MESRPPGSAKACRLCATNDAEDRPICFDCERSYGPRVARLLARAESDRDFAATCLLNLPPLLRERFASLLGQRCLRPGADSPRGPGLRPARPRPSAKWLQNAN